MPAGAFQPGEKITERKWSQDYYSGKGKQELSRNRVHEHQSRHGETGQGGELQV